MRATAPRGVCSALVAPAPRAAPSAPRGLAPHARCTVRRARPRCAPCVAAAADASGVAAAPPAAAQTGLIFGTGAAGAFDSHSVGGPALKCFIGDNETRWMLWYHGRSTPAPGPAGASDGALGAIGLAVSSDGVTWRRGSGAVETMSSGGAASEGSDCGIVLDMSPDWWCFDTAAVGAPDVQVLSSGAVAAGVGVYWMFYSGADFNVAPPARGPGAADVAPGPDAPGRRLLPGLALSQDGRNWARVEGEHHSGALLGPGAAGAWDAAGCARARALVAAPRDLRMFYASPDAATGAWAIGVARSADGLAWKKAGRVFERGPAGAWDAAGVTAPHVHRTGVSSWVMFYEGHSETGERGIGVAVSRDGMSWSRPAGGGRVLSAPADAAAWDAGGVGAPFAVPMAAGRWRLYYEGYGAEGLANGWEGHGAAAPRGIGLALSAELSDDNDDVTTRAFRRRTGA